MSHQRSYYHDVQLACYHIVKAAFNLFQAHIQMASPQQAGNDLQEGDPKRDPRPSNMISNDQSGSEGEEEDDDDNIPTFDWNHRGRMRSNVKGSPNTIPQTKKAGVSSPDAPQSTSVNAPATSSGEPMATTTETQDDEPTTSDQNEVVIEDETTVEDKGKKPQTADENEESGEDEIPEFGWKSRGKLGSNVQGNTKTKAAIEAQKEKERLKAAKAQPDPKASADPKKANKK